MCYIIAHEKKALPSIFLNFISLAKSTHSYNTRFASNLNFSRPSVRTNYGLRYQMLWKNREILHMLPDSDR